MENGIITLFYHEKHYPCMVKLKPSGDSHNIYIKSQPLMFSRKHNKKVNNHEICEIIEFRKGNDILLNKNYFDYCI